MAGMFAAFGTVSAIYQREISGKGQKVDVAMLDSQVAMLENAVAKYSANGIVPQPMGLRHPVITPFDGFETQDGHIIIACGNDRLFQALCEVLELGELLQDERFLTNPKRTEHVDELTPLIAQKLKMNTTAHWTEKLLAKNVPCAPINTIDKLFEDPQIAARNMLVEVEQLNAGKFKIAGNPVKMSLVDAADEVSHDPAPEIGVHTQEVLTDLLGYSAEEAEAYIRSVQS